MSYDLNCTFLFSLLDKFFWTQGFQMKQSKNAIPLFLDDMANDIFACGKAINLLRLTNIQVKSFDAVSFIKEGNQTPILITRYGACEEPVMNKSGLIFIKQNCVKCPHRMTYHVNGT